MQSVLRLLSTRRAASGFRHNVHHPTTHKAISFSGPPTYGALYHRLTQGPNSVAYTERESGRKGVEDDIHAICPIDPKQYDVLLSDLDDATLRTNVARIAGIEYLAKAGRNVANQKVEIAKGFLYGIGRRTILPCVVGYKDKAHWVFFVVDGGAPLTYLSVQTAETFGINTGDTKVKIMGYDHSIFLSGQSSNFAQVNILGADFCHAAEMNSWYNYDQKTVTFYLGSHWRPEFAPIKREK